MTATTPTERQCLICGEIQLRLPDEFCNECSAHYRHSEPYVVPERFREASPAVLEGFEAWKASMAHLDNAPVLHAGLATVATEELGPSTLRGAADDAHDDDWADDEDREELDPSEWGDVDADPVVSNE